MNNKILLIAPCMDVNKRYPSSLRIPEIALSTIAGFTPDHFTVDIIEEEVEDINFDTDHDLIGISSMTATAPRSYQIAAEFKKRGKIVVMGGVHPTILPDEALLHADSVVIGEAEGAWELLLEDYLQGRLKRKYLSYQPDISNYPIPRRDFNKKSRSLYNLKSISTTRGCPYNCDFCCVPKFFGKKLRHVPVERVVRDIAASKAKVMVFCDDNILGRPQYAKELFKAITPLNIKWVSQASISFVKDEELMKLAKKSGCMGFFFGLESVSESQLKNMRKNYSDISKIEESIKRVKDIGMIFHASMIFGMDDDKLNVFDDTLEFVLRNKISSTSFNILTPYPGTKIFEDLDREGRLLTKKWEYYNHDTVVFQPKHMTPMQLAEGYLRVKKEFYTVKSIAKRFRENRNHPFVYLGVNYGYRSELKFERSALQNKMDIICNDIPCNHVKSDLGLLSGSAAERRVAGDPVKQTILR
ncbi:MAG: B12-binding domain-containing radical SAM protein [bacterium]|nr:B12-binding domain-containing radical SAM protein [bacterium]